MNAIETIERGTKLKRKTIVRYEVAEGSFGRLTNADAALIGSELEQIEQANGKITAEAVVERAFTPGTPLFEWDLEHHFFEADVAKAAQLYRIEQARHLIRAIEVVIEPANSAPIRTRAFQNVGTQDDRGYRNLGAIAENDEFVQSVIKRFRRDLERLSRDYDYFRRWAQFNHVAAPVLDVIATTLKEDA